MNIDNFLLIKKLRNGELKVSVPDFKIKKICKGRCKKALDETELVNGWCIFCEPQSKEGGFMNAINYTKFDDALAALAVENEKLAENVRRMEMLAPDLPVRLNNELYKCHECEEYYPINHITYEDNDGHLFCHCCHEYDNSDSLYEQIRDVEESEIIED